MGVAGTESMDALGRCEHAEQPEHHMQCTTCCADTECRQTGNINMMQKGILLGFLASVMVARLLEVVTRSAL